MLGAIHVQDGKTLSLEQIRESVQTSGEIRFKGKGRAEIYGWVARTLRQQHYRRQDRAAKGGGLGGHHQGPWSAPPGATIRRAK
jgi:hypothetical protein